MLDDERNLKGGLPGADLLAAALARADLSPKAHAFLLDVQRQAARRPLTLRQLQAVERIATTAPRVDFAAVNRAALARLPHFQLGSRIVTRRSTLMDWIALQEGFANA